MVSALWNRLWSLKGGCSTTKPRKKLLVEFGGGFQLRIMASSVKDVYRQIAKWSAEPFPSGVGYREIVTAERNKDWHGHHCRVRRKGEGSAGIELLGDERYVYDHTLPERARVVGRVLPIVCGTCHVPSNERVARRQLRQRVSGQRRSVLLVCGLPASRGVHVPEQDDPGQLGEQHQRHRRSAPHRWLAARRRRDKQRRRRQRPGWS